MDDRTVRIPLQFANSGFPDDLGQYFNAIVPTDYDPENPVGTGPFKYESFTAGRAERVHRSTPTTGRTASRTSTSSTIIDFPDDTARVNALLGGQVDAIDNLPAAQIAERPGEPEPARS